MPNLIMPVAPMFKTIMESTAQQYLKKLCRVKSAETEINVSKERSISGGDQNENLELANLPTGTVGLVVGTTEHGTVLRFLVANDTQEDGIYHVGVLFLEPCEDEFS